MGVTQLKVKQVYTALPCFEQ